MLIFSDEPLSLINPTCSEPLELSMVFNPYWLVIFLKEFFQIAREFLTVFRSICRQRQTRMFKSPSLDIWRDGRGGFGDKFADRRKRGVRHPARCLTIAMPFDDLFYHPIGAGLQMYIFKK